jgi:hypothetical protein
LIAFYAIRHPCAKRCSFLAIGQSEDSLQNDEQLIYNGVERNQKTDERSETQILLGSDAKDIS